MQNSYKMHVPFEFLGLGKKKKLGTLQKFCTSFKSLLCDVTLIELTNRTNAATEGSLFCWCHSVSDKTTPTMDPQQRFLLPSNQNHPKEKSCHYQMVTLLSVIDEEGSEADLYENLDDIDLLTRRESLTVQLRKSWRLGLFLALLSGVLFTGNNFLIQYFHVEPFEILLVRSLFQVKVIK